MANGPLEYILKCWNFPEEKREIAPKVTPKNTQSSSKKSSSPKGGQRNRRNRGTDTGERHNILAALRSGTDARGQAKEIQDQSPKKYFFVDKNQYNF